MTARSVPDRALRCQPSPFAIAAAASGSPASRTGCSPAVTISVALPRRDRRPLAFGTPSSRFQISACSRSSAAIASISGAPPCPA